MNKIERKTLIILVGISGSGKSTFAEKHFLPTMISSTDNYRAIICDTEQIKLYQKMLLKCSICI